MRESLILVFEFLDIKDVINASQVSKEWNAAVNNHRVWMSLCFKDQRFSVDPVKIFLIHKFNSKDDIINSHLDSKQFYKEKYRIWRNICNKVFTPRKLSFGINVFEVSAIKPPYLFLIQTHK